MIDSFKGKYRFLSNFYPSPIVVNGQKYPTVEHAFQAAKTKDRRWKRRIREAVTPGTAKRLGRMAPLRSDWEDIRIPIMKNLSRKKYADDPYRSWLLATDDEELIEGNNWGDTFWGACNGVGENHLGHILMQIRKELR